MRGLCSNCVKFVVKFSSVSCATGRRVATPKDMQRERERERWKEGNRRRGVKGEERKRGDARDREREREEVTFNSDWHTCTHTHPSLSLSLSPLALSLLSVYSHRELPFVQSPLNVWRCATQHNNTGDSCCYQCAVFDCVCSTRFARGCAPLAYTKTQEKFDTKKKKKMMKMQKKEGNRKK